MFERYSIKENETLYDVASKFNTDVEFLKSINNIYYVDNLRAGTDIIVPKEYEDYFNIYIIEKGDSLYKIAKRYNINPELLASLNGFNYDDYIYPNQEILIPKANYSYYITEKGDTLASVSQRFNTTIDKLLNYNKTIYLADGQIIVNKKK